MEWEKQKQEQYTSIADLLLYSSPTDLHVTGYISRGSTKTHEPRTPTSMVPEEASVSYENRTKQSSCSFFLLFPSSPEFVAIPGLGAQSPEKSIRPSRNLRKLKLRFGGPSAFGSNSRHKGLLRSGPSITLLNIILRSK